MKKIVLVFGLLVCLSTAFAEDGCLYLQKTWHTEHWKLKCPTYNLYGKGTVRFTGESNNLTAHVYAEFHTQLFQMPFHAAIKGYCNGGSFDFDGNTLHLSGIIPKKSSIEVSGQIHSAGLLHNCKFSGMTMQ